MTKRKTVTKEVTEETDAVFIPERKTPTGEKTQIICILDTSGSMATNNIILEARNGFNNFLKEQKKLDEEATITVALFDDNYELLYDDVDIQKVKDITEAEWFPKGTTALYDAIGKTINEVKANNKKSGHKKPDKVLVCIVTDGLENASKEYKGVEGKNQIRKLIKKCEKNDWNFIYLAANQDAFDVGTDFGISGGNTYNFAPTMDGARKMSNVMSFATSSYIGMNTSTPDFKLNSKKLISDQEEDEDLNEGDLGKTNSGTIKMDDGSITSYTTTNSTGAFISDVSDSIDEPKKEKDEKK